jgi:DNA-binding protein H-NS
MSVRSALNAWRELSLQDQIVVAKVIFAEIGAVKSERAKEAQAGLSILGGSYEHHHSKGAPKNPTSRYRSLRDASRSWAGLGEVPRWLQDEIETSERPLTDFKVR